jgi:antitoxin component YwqK of YwqJK toxin-antitoxin module
MKKTKIVFIFLSILLLASCSRKTEEPPKLVSLQFIDRNGFNETISTVDRIERYKKANFLESQPYQKIIRVFERNREGKTLSAVTSYHANGQIWQYLEVVNGRAHGAYKEWYPNGMMKIQAHVVEGVGDVALDCMSSWVFDAESLAYDEKGNLLAKFFYDKGDLSGKAIYYHSNGKIRKTTPYVKNELHGDEIYYDAEGEKTGKISYHNGVKHGKSIYQGCKNCPKFTEEYKQGLLISGVYYNFDGRVMSKIIEGNGLQTVYEEGKLINQYEFKEGIREGKVYLYGQLESLVGEYSIKQGVKHGEEWVYYENAYPKQQGLHPKIFLTWYEGKLQGRVKTWYPSGTLESEKEMYNNKKNGPTSAWYKDGAVMLIEEYENDQLVKGIYIKKGEKSPVSVIENGEGIATLYDSDGYFLKKIKYYKGIPTENE